MPQDAYTISRVTDELKNLLTGGKISRITQSGRDDLTFIIYTEKGTVKLDVCLSARGQRISLTDSDRPSPQNAPAFCMLLRKHLQNAQIERIEQIPFERIVFFDFLCTSEFETAHMRLYVELMGKYSNAVLTRDGIISGALKSTALGENTKRALFTGVRYVLPEPQDKILPSDSEAMEKLFENFSGDGAKFISDRVKGVAYSTAADILETLGERPSAKDVAEYLCGDYSSPCVVFAAGEPADFRVRSCGTEKKTYPTILEAQKAYYDYTLKKKALKDAKDKLSNALGGAVKKLEKRLQNIHEKLLECRDAEDVRLKGELLTANIYAVPRGADSFEAVNYYDERGGKINIPLDRTMTAAQNAQRYFKRYAKLKRTEENAKAQLGEANAKLGYFESIGAHICAAECLCDLTEIAEELKKAGILKEENDRKKKKDAPAPFRSYFVDGFRIVAGRNNLQNDRLLKSLSGNDLWLHTQGYHSAHVAILCGGKETPGNVLQAAAEICAYYSGGRGGGKVFVDYTLKKHVKKPPASAPGFVVYTDYKTLAAEPKSHIEECENADK